MELQGQGKPAKGPARKAASQPGRKVRRPQRTVLKVGLGSTARLILAALLFAGSTWWALTRFSRPDPFQSPPLLSWAWFLRPLEVNAPARLPVVSGTLTAIAASEDGAEAWVAGQQGTLLRYRRRSQEWESLTLPDSVGRPALEAKPAGPGPAKP
jgi:hypothetical protein